MTIFEDPQYLFLRSKLNEPNVFLFLRNTAYEIRHSNFLRWLLDPTESHGLEDRFLIEFLRLLNLNPLFTDTLVFEREKWGIDLLLHDRETVIVIENKTRTKDSVGQLAKYRKVIEKHFPDHFQIFLYLTPSGETPTDLAELVDWKTASYHQILSAIDRVSKEVENNKVKVYLQDYSDALQLNLLSNSRYVSLAKKLLTVYPQQLNEMFVGKIEVSRLDRRTVSYIKQHSGFVRGEGFFAAEKPYLQAFERAFKKFRYHRLPSGKTQSTYLTFWPGDLWAELKGERLGKDLPFGFSFRFSEKVRKLDLRFSTSPEAPGDEGIRSAILANLQGFHQITAGMPVRRPGKRHIAVLYRQIPFDPMTITPEELDMHIEQLFVSSVEPFVTQVSEKIRDNLVSNHPND